MESAEANTAKPSVFDRLESEVQSYARAFPVTFDRAEGARIWDRDGHAYLDFLAGAGSLNYGHNHPVLREALIGYIERGGIAHGLDFHTVAKARFLEALNRHILAPRGLDYVVQFTGPTGTNAVEAALKLARRIKERANVLFFTNGFHGVSLGAMGATANSHHRDAAGVPLTCTTPMPYDGYFGADVDTIAYIDRLLSDPSSGVDQPAAAIVECVQGEGGLNAASAGWLRRLSALCRKHDMLLIVDDIQAGCGRTGRFFGFEEAGIVPDIVTLSKSLSGFGIPFALTLFKRELDAWKPGEHNGTFRGNNHAFVTATAAIETFWQDDGFASQVRAKGEILRRRLAAIAGRYEADAIDTRGRGMMRGLDMKTGETAARVTRRCFEDGLIIETSGPDDEVVKCLCPLVISEADLNRGLDIIESAVAEVLADKVRAPALTAAE
jgi:diaminobutyrate-2-oxoglutarate transaminase